MISNFCCYLTLFHPLRHQSVMGLEGLARLDGLQGLRVVPKGGVRYCSMAAATCLPRLWIRKSLEIGLLVSQVIRMSCESSRVLPINMRGDVTVGNQVKN